MKPALEQRQAIPEVSKDEAKVTQIHHSLSLAEPGSVNRQTYYSLIDVSSLRVSLVAREPEGPDQKIDRSHYGNGGRNLPSLPHIRLIGLIDDGLFNYVIVTRILDFGVIARCASAIEKFDVETWFSTLTRNVTSLEAWCW